MGETGENVAERWGVSRADQDAFALESQRRWAAADAAGRFAEELVPVGECVRDEHPRPSSTPEALAKLRTVFRAGWDGHRGQLQRRQRRRRGARGRKRRDGGAARRRTARALRRLGRRRASIRG